MTQEDITRAFEGRWRIKGFDQYEVRQLSGEDVKRYCRDFFETGIIIAESPVQCAANLPQDSFNIWWQIYDKKRAREKCLAKWNKLSPQEQQACVDATPAYVASTPDKQYRKDPLTYLNQKAWNDEIIARNDSAQQRLSKLADILKS